MTQVLTSPVKKLPDRPVKNLKEQNMTSSALTSKQQIDISEVISQLLGDAPTRDQNHLSRQNPALFIDQMIGDVIARFISRRNPRFNDELTLWKSHFYERAENSNAPLGSFALKCLAKKPRLLEAVL